MGHHRQDEQQNRAVTNEMSDFGRQQEQRNNEDEVARVGCPQGAALRNPFGICPFMLMTTSLFAGLTMPGNDKLRELRYLAKGKAPSNREAIATRTEVHGVFAIKPVNHYARLLAIEVLMESNVDPRKFHQVPKLRGYFYDHVIAKRRLPKRASAAATEKLAEIQKRVVPSHKGSLIVSHAE